MLVRASDHRAPSAPARAAPASSDPDVGTDGDDPMAVTINGERVTVPPGLTVIDAMRFAADAVNKLTQETFDPTPVSPNTGCRASPSRHSARTLGRTCCGRPMPEPAAELRTGTAEMGVVCPAVGSWLSPLERIPCDKIGREGCHRVCRGDVDFVHTVPDSQGRPRSWRHSLSRPM